MKMKMNEARWSIEYSRNNANQNNNMPLVLVAKSKRGEKEWKKQTKRVLHKFLCSQRHLINFNCVENIEWLKIISSMMSITGKYEWAL